MSEAPKLGVYPRPAKPENSLKIVWMLAWPAVALNSLQTLNALLDTYFISNVSRQAMTAIGASTPINFLFFSLTMALGIAATAIVSRAFGSGDHDECVTANGKCLKLSLYLGVAVLFVGIPTVYATAGILSPPNDPEAKRLFIEYATIFIFSLPAVFVIQTLAGSLRGIGDTRSPMVVSGIQIVLHILLNFFLILDSQTVLGIQINGMGLGLKGAAIAMVISAWIAAGIYIWWSGRTTLETRFSFAWPGMEWAKRIMKIAAPASMMAIVRVTSLGTFTFILRSLPDPNQASLAVAAIRPGFAIESFAFMPAFGLSIAAATLVGQSLGMKDPERAQRLALTAAHQAGLVGFVVSVFLFIFADELAGFIISGEPGVAEVTANFIRYIASTELFFGYAMVFVRSLQGAGDTKSPMWLSIWALWGVRVPLAAVLALPSISFFGLFDIPGVGMGANGAWLSMAITMVLQGTAAAWIFMQGKWKTKQV